ncbi:MAG: type II toxin-antitoxin system VapC family toxin [Streptosporangiaceae bacterium]
MTAPARGSFVVDTSAAVAIILGEPGSGELAVHLEKAVARLMPAAIRVELGIVIETRLWPAGQDVVDRFLRDAKIDIVPADADVAARRRAAGGDMARGATQEGSILATASRTRWRSGPGTRCYAPETTSPRRISPWCALSRRRQG